MAKSMGEKQTHRSEDCIFNTTGCVSGESGPFGRVEAGDSLDQPNGADGDEVVLVGVLGVIFFGRVKQREGFSRLKAASHGPPNFK